MQWHGRQRGVSAALIVLVVLAATPVWAVEALVDAFSDASAATQFVTDTNVRRDTLGSTVRVDPNLTGVIGGVRQLTVTATALAAPMADFVVGGVAPLPSSLFVSYATVQADGSFDLLYDRNGLGLNAFLAFAQGIEVEILVADMAAVAPPGMDVTVTITDSSMIPRSQTQTVLLPVMGPPLPLHFPFSAFLGLNPRSLFSIEVRIDPQVAFDLRLATIQTFGTSIEETICNDGIDNNNNGFTDCEDVDCHRFPACGFTVPALSPSAMVVASIVLTAIGLMAVWRLRRDS